MQRLAEKLVAEDVACRMLTLQIEIQKIQQLFPKSIITKIQAAAVSSRRQLSRH